jgi:ERCC4-related helicase/DNA uptake protein ComE-like DNA-binding protein
MLQEPRIYQQTIFATAARRNTMVVLPTGLGKTMIFLMLAELRLRQFQDSKVLMLSPTKPLAEQHLQSARAQLELPGLASALLTGETPPEQRKQLWNSSNLIFCTPQTIENDIISGRVKLEEVSLICFDECHRAIGDYSYVWVAGQYMAKARHPKVLGLTASPGSELEKITEIVRNLHLEDIEIRAWDDEDVRPYVQETTREVIMVHLPERFKLIKGYLEKAISRKLADTETALGQRLDKPLSKTRILELQRSIHAMLKSEAEPGLFRAISLLAEALKLLHALELLETQGSFALHDYLSRLMEESSRTTVKAVKHLVVDPDFKASLFLTEQLVQEGIEHPKLEALIKLVEKETRQSPQTKIIVFNHYRDSAKRLEGAINELGCARAKLFVGQAKRAGTGLSQKAQKAMLEEFRAGEFNVLISTSIGEEGLDIPAVDLVVFYEPVPSAIRSIQRRGRTGRQAQGRVVVLIAKATKDEAYSWASHHKEQRMYRLLKDIKAKLGLGFVKEQRQLPSYAKKETGVRVIADAREKGSSVLKALSEKGAAIELRKLDSADYVCSKDVGIEFKTQADFVNSIVDKRLLMHAKLLRENFNRPLIIIQETSEHSSRLVSPEAVTGMLISLAIGFNIPVLNTKTPLETANLIYAIAKSEQTEDSSEFSLHFNKPLSLKEQQEYLVSALPGIGPKLARPLLKRFGSIKNIVDASKEQLQEVELIGKKKSAQIKQVLEGFYTQP